MSTASINCGVNSLDLEVVGKKISEVRSFLSNIISIDDTYKAEQDGNSLSESYEVQEGDNIEFVKQSGSKGMPTASIDCGVNSLELEVVGKTISEVRTFLATIISIDSSYKAEQNGGQLSEDYVVLEGDSIEFVKQSGSKG